MIYYYFYEDEEKTFTDINLARLESLKDNVLKYRDTLGGEYFN